LRPTELYPLFAGVETLPGVGKQTAQLLARLVGATVVDLIWHLPVQIVQRQRLERLADAVPGTIVTIAVDVLHHQPSPSPKRPHRVTCGDGERAVTLVYFHARGDWLERTLPVGQRRIVSGRIEAYQDKLQIAHPDHVVPVDQADSIPATEAVHALTTGLAPRTLKRAIRAALERLPDLAEWLDPTLVTARGWQGWRPALLAAHAPTAIADLDPTGPHRSRLAYDELLANQLALGLLRQHHGRRRGRALRVDGPLRQALPNVLPFTPTGAQLRALAEIDADLVTPKPMMRLLQGDVGSGKTMVALATLLAAVDSGHQAALMAPTEILARQHALTLAPLLDRLGVTSTLLLGAGRGKARERALVAIADGMASIVIGTHAMFQDEVRFADLALAVIDEQHRFGVDQRIALAAKGAGVDLLIMTATPIPRTLAMTSHGDLEVSRLDEKPPGRKPIDTRVLSVERLPEIVDAVGRAIDTGSKVYWICPLVEESESVDLAAATDRHAALTARFGPRVGLVHGRMKSAERERVMAAFAGHDTAEPCDLLVATTVVEVGVDVPAATVIVIEQAERFGLAQLHQLRGRVGRGDQPSRCLLLYRPPLGETAKARLRTLRESEDGFHIAEADLKLRGAGEVLGTRQSGLPAFKIADLATHADLVAVARDDARLALSRDPTLESPRGHALRVLLHLFERDAAARYLRAG
jgi:ATP-dependent DNA helicase RecG